MERVGVSLSRQLGRANRVYCVCMCVCVCVCDGVGKLGLRKLVVYTLYTITVLGIKSEC